MVVFGPEKSLIVIRSLSGIEIIDTFDEIYSSFFGIRDEFK
jgi:hypothetical protein